MRKYSRAPGHCFDHLFMKSKVREGKRKIAGRSVCGHSSNTDWKRKNFRRKSGLLQKEGLWCPRLFKNKLYSFLFTWEGAGANVPRCMCEGQRQPAVGLSLGDTDPGVRLSWSDMAEPSLSAKLSQCHQSWRACL